MTSISEEIQQLQLRILELEKQQTGLEENDKKTSIEYNFKVLNNLLNEKKTNVANDRYSKSVPVNGGKCRPSCGFVRQNNCCDLDLYF